MSYDVAVGKADFNYTYNLSELFHKHIVGEATTGLQALHDATGSEARYMLAAAFESIHSEYFDADRGLRATCKDLDRAMSARYTPDNGWGSYTSALIFLAQLMAACAANPRAKVRVS